MNSYDDQPGHNLVQQGEVVTQLRKAGFSEFVSRLTAKVLMEAESAGKRTHGLSLLPKIAENLRRGLVRPDLVIHRVHSENGIIVLDCNSSLGYASAALACRYCIKLSKEMGCCCVVLKNIDHIGAAGVYAKRAAERSCICFVAALGKARIAPANTRTPVFGTTPISIALPSTGKPVVIDTSLAQLSVNRVMELEELGGRLPMNSAIDRNGNPTNDPTAALRGAFLPIGGHKGASLAFALHILIHSLADSQKGDHPVIMLMMATQTNPTFRKNVSSIYSEIEQIVADNPGARMPGERFRR